ncbi:hypothetical protein MHO82_02070 [Vibrio sp. Of7-15]|uniref:hypothetical protein n=1 Tax=Vibrio sp. Of7-15 TaxID=2724879 RepID=UPI001EF24B16|nr:hypothetical protein [Vibrio sp. Of7-15]MCG7495642.1 hypothetical protein [Vibrio sp. Of7-15]
MEKHRKQALPTVRFNYLGQLEPSTQQGSGMWQVEALGCGVTVPSINHEPMTLDINGAIQNNALVFFVSTSLPKAKSAQFSEEFKRAIESVILQSTTALHLGSVKTASDYVASLSTVRLEKIKLSVGDSGRATKQKRNSIRI